MKDNDVTRRDVLKSVSALAARAVAPYVITSAALGAEDKLPASERITLAHIGVGTRGAFLLNQACPVASGIQSVAVADCYRDRRDAAAAAISGEAYVDFREILARDDVDGVIIATPDHWHVPIALLAARAGKACYVEKPLALTVEQDLVCQRAFGELNVVLQYGTQQREAAHIQFGRELVRSGKLGELRRIEVGAPDGRAGGSTAEAPVPPGFDYEMWLGPAPQVPYTVDRCVPPGTYFIYDHSIGLLGGWGAHPLDVLVWCYDGDQAGPYSVEGTGTVAAGGLYDTVNDWDMTLRMADGVTVTFVDASPASTKFIGTEGRLELTRNSIRAFPTMLVDREIPANDHRVNSARHIEDFADAIRTGRQPSSSIDAAVRSDTISQLCDIAVRTGERVTWDPHRQELVGASDQARAMLSRPLREPWTL